VRLLEDFLFKKKRRPKGDAENDEVFSLNKERGISFMEILPLFIKTLPEANIQLCYQMTNNFHILDRVIQEQAVVCQDGSGVICDRPPLLPCLGNLTRKCSVRASGNETSIILKKMILDQGGNIQPGVVLNETDVSRFIEISIRIPLRWTGNIVNFNRINFEHLIDVLIIRINVTLQVQGNRHIYLSIRAGSRGGDISLIDSKTNPNLVVLFLLHHRSFTSNMIFGV